MYRNYNKLQSIIIGTSADSWHQIPPNIRQEYKEKLFSIQKGKCGGTTHYGCLKELDIELLEVDHIIAISIGGPVCDLGNMQLLCKDCHDKKTKLHDNQLIEGRIAFKESKKFIYSC